jgi:hypothetical protein
MIWVILGAIIGTIIIAKLILLIDDRYKEQDLEAEHKAGRMGFDYFGSGYYKLLDGEKCICYLCYHKHNIR